MLYIDANINNAKIPAMMDTGSELSCIDYSLVERLGLINNMTKDVGYTVKGAFDQNSEYPFGEVDIMLKIGRSEYEHTFTVTKMANPESIILGLDFFNIHNYHLSCEEGHAALTLNGTNIPVVPRVIKGNTCNVVHLQMADPSLPKPQVPDNEAKVFRRIVIPALSYALVKVFLPENTPLHTDVCVEMKNTLPEGVFFPDVRARVLSGSGHNKHNKQCINQNDSAPVCSGCAEYKYTVFRVRNTTYGNIMQ